MFKRLAVVLFLLAQIPLCFAQSATAGARDYALAAGDVIRVQVFQNPDLSVEARVSESGNISFPLVGSVPIGGLTLPVAERKLAQMLREGGFVLQPQVSILLLQVKGNQVAVLGQVNRPGRYPLETFNIRLTDMLAQAGGIAQTGAEVVVLSGMREGRPIRREIDISAMFAAGTFDDDVILSGGDTLYVQRAQMFYIYGEVQRPGSFRLERAMSVMQGLALGGGITMRGTLKGIRLHRRGSDGKLQLIEPELDTVLAADDVIYVRESLF